MSIVASWSTGIWRLGTLAPAVNQKEIMKQNHDHLWIVVEVESGIAVDAKAYRTRAAAMRRKSGRRNALNPEDDDIQIFEVRRPRR